MWRNTASTMRCAAIRCTDRIHDPNVTTYSMSFTDAYARSTDGTYRKSNGPPDRMRRTNSAAETAPSQNEYVQSSEALYALAGNQWSRKFETIASPACRSERGRRLHNRRP